MSDGCKMYEPLLHCLLDGEVTEAERAVVEAHLAACPACAARYRELEAVHTALQGLEVPVPEGLRERTMARIRQERVRQRQRAMARWGRGLMAAAACCAIVFVGLSSRFGGADQSNAGLSGGAANGSAYNDTAGGDGSYSGGPEDGQMAPCFLMPEAPAGSEEDLSGSVMPPEGKMNSGIDKRSAEDGYSTEDAVTPDSGEEENADTPVRTVETSEVTVGLWLASNRGGEEGPYLLSEEESAALNSCLTEAERPTLPEGPLLLVYLPEEP